MLLVKVSMDSPALLLCSHKPCSSMGPEALERSWGVCSVHSLGKKRREEEKGGKKKHMVGNSCFCCMWCVMPGVLQPSGLHETSWSLQSSRQENKHLGLCGWCWTTELTSPGFWTPWYERQCISYDPRHFYLALLLPVAKYRTYLGGNNWSAVSGPSRFVWGLAQPSSSGAGKEDQQLFLLWSM
jgi:hypothetical protein